MTEIVSFNKLLHSVEKYGVFKWRQSKQEKDLEEKGLDINLEDVFFTNDSEICVLLEMEL